MSAPQVLEAKRYPDFAPLIGRLENNDLVLVWQDSTGKNRSVTYQNFVSQVQIDAGLSIPNNLQDLQNVVITSPQGGHTLVYNSELNVFINRNLQASDIQGLQDLLDNKVSKWEAWNSDLNVLGITYADNFVFSDEEVEEGSGSVPHPPLTLDENSSGVELDVLNQKLKLDVYTRAEIKEITGLRDNLNTQNKANLVAGINEANTWTQIEW